jgi:hypothetical protein
MTDRRYAFGLMATLLATSGLIVPGVSLAQQANEIE